MFKLVKKMKRAQALEKIRSHEGHEGEHQDNIAKLQPGSVPELKHDNKGGGSFGFLKKIISAQRKHRELEETLRIKVSGQVGGYPVGPQGEFFKRREKKVDIEEIAGEGIVIPSSEYDAQIKLKPLEEREDMSSINLRYNLIPQDPNKPAFAKANIRWSPENNSLMYYVIEPELDDRKKELISTIKSMLEEEIDVDFSKLRRSDVYTYLQDEIGKIINELQVSLLPAERQTVEYFIIRDFIGLERVEALMHDPNIEDISCAGAGIPLYVFHRNSKFGSLRTNIIFRDREELDKFAIKLAQKLGKGISVAEPLVDGALPDGSRVQITLATDIARRGSNFTIRKFTEKPITPIDLLNYETGDARLLAFLWLSIEYGRSILIAGSTASGKTSALNALSLFIRPERKIVTIEDTAELRLPHPHWVPEVARSAITETGTKSYGAVDMYDLLRESLRQRPEYIIVGEVRGKEAFVMFQQMATGHTGLGTIHADTMQRLIDRLTTSPISLPESLIQNLDLIVFMINTRYKGSFKRKISEIYEIVGFEKGTGLKLNKVFHWNASRDSFDVVGKSVTLKKIAERLGAHDSDIRGELVKRMKILNWMKQKKVLDYKENAKIFSFYYTNPEELFSKISRET